MGTFLHQMNNNIAEIPFDNSLMTRYEFLKKKNFKFLLFHFVYMRLEVEHCRNLSSSSAKTQATQKIDV